MFHMNKHESRSYESDHQKKGKKPNGEGEACCCGPASFLCMSIVAAGEWIKRISIDR